MIEYEASVTFRIEVQVEAEGEVQEAIIKAVSSNPTKYINVFTITDIEQTD